MPTSGWGQRTVSSKKITAPQIQKLKRIAAEENIISNLTQQGGGSFHSQGSRPQDRSRTSQKARRLWAILISSRRIFRKIGIMAEKAHLLSSTHGHFLTNRIQSMSILLAQIGWVDTSRQEMVPNVIPNYLDRDPKMTFNYCLRVVVFLQKSSL